MGNGGLSIPKVGLPQDTKGSFNTTIQRSANKLDGVSYGNNRSLAKSPASFYYPPDGTGRDWYITNSNGGLITKYDRPANQYFESSLRYNYLA
jgi:hypothetical protein